MDSIQRDIIDSTQTAALILEKAPYFPPDIIFSVKTGYLADSHPEKILLSNGIYCDGEGKPWVLPAVRLAEIAIKNAGHEYLPIAGLKEFRERALELIFHGTQALREGRIASCQSLSGTGALFLAGYALKDIDSNPRDLLSTSPTWPNHELIFKSLGYPVKEILYYSKRRFDFDGYIAALESAQSGSVIVLHACAHNPTGCDPSQLQWKAIASVIRARNLFPIFDSAYLGFNSGNLDRDAWAIRYFVEDLGLEIGLCLSFAKNMGLYGERIGLVAFVTKSISTMRKVNTVLERAQRATISTPPLYGALLVSTVLGTPELKAQWEKDIITMSRRISSMRQKLYQKLNDLHTPGDWSHIVSDTGMFSLLGLTPRQVIYARKIDHVYMVETSRIAITSLHDGNLDHFAQAVDRAVRNIM